MDAVVTTGWLAGRLGRPDLRVVDVRWYLDPSRRGRDAYAAGHLPGAISIPLADLSKRYREIPKSARVVLYCQCPLEDMGGVHKFLQDLGYRNHVVLEDGFDGWFRSQYPLVK